MRLNRIVLFFAIVMLASSALAQDSQIYNLDPEALRVSVTSEPVGPSVSRMPVSAQAPGREPEIYPLRCGFEGLTTPKASMSVLGPDEDGKYKVPFSAWFPVPEGTTMIAYQVDVDGNKTPIPGGSFAVTAENANLGWAIQLWGPFTDGAPIPESVTGFRMEFTGAFPTYSVNARVPDSSRIPALVDVYPNGKLFLRVWMCPSPVVSLGGRAHSVVNGWITPMEGYARPEVPVAICSGFPDSECLTQEVDIPNPQ